MDLTNRYIYTDINYAKKFSCLYILINMYSNLIFKLLFHIIVF